MIVLHAVKSKTKSLALSGILLALSLALLYLKTIVPVIDFSIYILISFFTGIILIESGYKTSFLFFVSLSLLSLILPVNKLEMLLFYSFFGYYGIIKFFIEKIKSKIIVFLVKLLFIVIVILMNFYFAREFIPLLSGGTVKLYIILPVASVFIFIYDYIYSLAMVFYNNKLRNIIRGKGNA